jgi:PAS domain S-box-containing protein
MQTTQDRNIETLASALEEASATIRSRTDELSLVRRIGDAICTTMSTPALCAEIAQALAETVNCRYVSVFSGPQSRPFDLFAVYSLFSSPDGFPSSLAKTRIAKVIQEKTEVVRIDDINSEGRGDSWPFSKDLTSFLFVPLVDGETLRGLLCLADDKPGAFDERIIRTVAIVVPQIAGAIAKNALHDDTQAAALKYRTLVESMREIVFICTSDWRVCDVNDAGQRMLGESPLGKSLSELFCSKASALDLMKAAERGSLVQDFEAALRNSQGGEVNALISCWKNEMGYAGVIKDITERTRMEEQITRAQKMESMGTLAAGVAHDFNNILGVILPNAELIKIKTAADPSISKFADVIIGMSKRASSLTKQLLALGKKGARQVRPINMNDAVGTMCRLFEETIGKNIRVELDFKHNPAYVRADASQVEQILLNLAINARDAMPKGGTLRFHTHIEAGRVVLSVKDTGVGMPPQVKARIFDPFFTTKEKSKGTGLGLSVVYNLVKQFHGTIDVQSIAGSGTEFVLSFPLCAVDPLRAGEAAGPAGGSERILVVDDEPEMLDLLEAGLKGLGYDVIRARDGQEALDAATEKVQLVVTDIVMPVMDGLASIRGIRQKLPDMKILVVSTHHTPESLPALRRMGVEAFVQKPFEFSHLAQTIRDVLDGVAA